MNRRSFLSGIFAAAVSAVLPAAVCSKTSPVEPLMGYKLIPRGSLADRVPGDLAYAALAQTQKPAMTTIMVEGSLVGDEGIHELLQETIGEIIDADKLIISPEFDHDGSKSIPQKLLDSPGEYHDDS